MKIALALMSILLLSGTVFADTPTVLESPSHAYSILKETIDTASPTAEWIFDVTEGGESYSGSSIKLLSLDRLNVKYADKLDLRLGWAETKVITLGVALDCTKLSSNPLAKFVHIGFSGFYDSDNNSWGCGPTVGVRASF